MKISQVVLALGVATFGVGRGGTVDGAFMRSGSGVARDLGATGGVTGSAFGGVGWTTPIWRWPGGAAMRFTR